MKRLFATTALVAWSVALMAVAGSTSASAADQPAPAKVDPARGATLYAEGDATHGLPACVACHGAAGNSTIGANPRLAGQGQAYLYKQLVDFTKPQRIQPVMTTFAGMLSDADKHNLAAYLSAQKPAPGAAKHQDLVDAGKRIYRGGIAEKSVAACASCHGATGAGLPIQYPRLAGQQQDYTVAQLTAFRAGTRKNNAPMATLAKRMSDDEIQAVADYIAGLK